MFTQLFSAVLMMMKMNVDIYDERSEFVGIMRQNQRNGLHFFSSMQHNWKGSAIKREAAVQVCAKVNARTFFCWNARRLEKTLFLRTYRKVGEWKQGGMNAGPQSAVSGMCWREPETRPNPHSRLHEQRLMHSCRKVLVHAQSHQKTASVVECDGQMVRSNRWHQLFRDNLLKTPIWPVRQKWVLLLKYF